MNGDTRAPRQPWASEAASFFGPVISGVVSGLCFCDARTHLLVWCALVPLAWTMAAGRGPAKYVGALVGGMCYHMLALDFLRQAYSGDAVTSWVAVAAILSFFWPVALALDQICLSHNSLPMSVRLPLVWTAAEFLRMQFAAAIMGAPVQYALLGSTIGDDLILAQVADIGGVYALTWLVATTNGTICDVLTSLFGSRRAPRRRINGVVGATLAVSVFAAVLAYSAWRLAQPFAEEGPSIALVPDDVPVPGLPRSDKRRDRLRRQLAASEHDGTVKALLAKPDLFVWSESAYGTPIVIERSHEIGVRDLEVLAQQLQAPILAGCERQSIRLGNPIVRRFNSLAYVTPEQGFAGSYDKTILVPWSEFQPPVATAMGLLPPAPGHAAYGGPYYPGDEYGIFELKTPQKSYRFATTICFEILSLELHRRLMTAHDGRIPHFFLSCANESAFDGPMYARMSATAQRLRAIECRRPYARIARDGLSAFVDGNGRVLRIAATSDDADMLVDRLPLDTRRSLYVMFGDWLPVCCCGVLTAQTLRRIRRRLSGLNRP
jgi:apolipoprotein N-acyltransferase